MTEKVSYIPARLKNAAKGGHVAGAIDIIDDILNRTQDAINQETVGEGNGSLKEQLAAIERIATIGDIDVQLTTNPNDIATTGEGATKLPLSIAIAGKLSQYYTKGEIDAIVELLTTTLLGTDEDSNETNTIKGLRAAINLLQQEIENLPHEGGGGGGGDTPTPTPTPTPSCNCMPHVVLTESEYEALQTYDANTVYLITEDSEWGFGDEFPIILT